jgi:hypothetical protein
MPHKRVLGSCSGNKVRRVAAPSFIAQMLYLEAFRDGFDPQFISHSMRCTPAAR